MKLAPWIRLIAYQERLSAAPPRRAGDTEADVRSRIGQRIVDQLRGAIGAEVKSAGHAAKRPAMRVDDQPPFGFQVTSTDAAASSRTLAIAFVGRNVYCKYCVVKADAEPGKSRWLEFAPDQRALAVWDQGVRRRFAGIEPLATFLLAAMSASETDRRDA